MKIKVTFLLTSGERTLWESPSVNKKIKEICAEHGVGYSRIEFPTNCTKTCQLDFVDEDMHRNNILKVEQYVNSIGIFCRILQWEVLEKPSRQNELSVLGEIKDSLKQLLLGVA